MADSVSNGEQEFVLFAKEIIRRLQSPSKQRWWEDIEGLSWALENCRRGLQSPSGITSHLPESTLRRLGQDIDCPALLIVTRRRGETVPEIARQYSDFPPLPKNKGLLSVTNMIYSDPFKDPIAKGVANLFVERDDETESEFGGGDKRQKVIACLQSWIRFVELATHKPVAVQAAVDTKPARMRKPRTMERKSREDVDLFVNAIIESRDAKELEFLLISTAEELGKRIGCDRKTVMKSKWWNDDRTAQRERYLQQTVVKRKSEPDG